MEYIESILSFINSAELAAWVAALTTLVAGATAVTALTPTRSDNRVVDFILLVLNFVAGNILNNKNADASNT